MLQISRTVLKADSHLLQQSAFSAVDRVHAEIEKFISLCRNATVHCGIRTSVNKPLAMKMLWIKVMLKCINDVDSGIARVYGYLNCWSIPRHLSWSCPRFVVLCEKYFLSFLALETNWSTFAVAIIRALIRGLVAI